VLELDFVPSDTCTEHASRTKISERHSSSVSSGGTSPDDSQTFTLTNGHTMGFSSCGPRDAARTIFFLHGLMGSRLEGMGFSKLADKLQARIVCPDRPGTGLSTFDSRRTLLDYPNDISQLANHIGIKRYGVLGGSGGGPYALACAKMLPKENLSAVGVFAGVGPPDEGFRELRLSSKLLTLATLKFPGILRWLVERYFTSKAQDPDPDIFRRFMIAQVKWGKASERKTLESDPESLELLVRITREAFRQSGDVFVKECQILTEPWGFKLSDVDFDGVRLWYGTDDINTPPSMGRDMAKSLKNAKLKEYDGATHFTLFDRCGEEALRDMLEE
jgi:pimeloyl-ACP methyl ester carboxylesterase